MRFVFSYDIPSGKPGDRRRHRLAKYLEKFGLRVQYSVFEIEIQPEKMPPIWKDIEDILDPAEDTVRIYCLCSGCNHKTVTIGRNAPVEHEACICW